MDPTSTPIALHGKPAEVPAPPWTWVDARLAAAGTYWVAVQTPGLPHSRPVWGVWQDGLMHLSIGSPAIGRAARPGVGATVHLDSGTDVVIMEGRVAGPSQDERVIAAYDRKYDWMYRVEQHGPLTTLVPSRVYAWRTGGAAGPDGFREAGSWTFPEG